MGCYSHNDKICKTANLSLKRFFIFQKLLSMNIVRTKMPKNLNCRFSRFTIKNLHYHFSDLAMYENAENGFYFFKRKRCNNIQFNKGCLSTVGWYTVV